MDAVSATASADLSLPSKSASSPNTSPGLNDSQQQLLALRGRHADTDASAEQRHHLIAGRADGEDRLAGIEGADARERNDRITLLGTQAAEQRAVGEKLRGFLQRSDRTEGSDRDHRGSGSSKPGAVVTIRDDGKPRQKPSGASMGRVLIAGFGL